MTVRRTVLKIVLRNGTNVLMIVPKEGTIRTEFVLMTVPSTVLMIVPKEGTIRTEFVPKEGTN
jgi:hypothetical protein